MQQNLSAQSKRNITFLYSNQETFMLCMKIDTFHVKKKLEGILCSTSSPFSLSGSREKTTVLIFGL